jgi:hypothetical protein
LGLHLGQYIKNDFLLLRNFFNGRPPSGAPMPGGTVPGFIAAEYVQCLNSRVSLSEYSRGYVRSAWSIQISDSWYHMMNQLKKCGDISKKRMVIA